MVSTEKIVVAGIILLIFQVGLIDNLECKVGIKADGSGIPLGGSFQSQNCSDAQQCHRVDVEVKTKFGISSK